MKISAGFIHLFLLAIASTVFVCSCKMVGNGMDYVKINSERGWIYPVKFRMEVPSEERSALQMCIQISYPQSNSYFPSEVKYRVPVGIYIRNSFNHVVSDTVIFSISGKEEEGMLTLSGGLLSAEREVVPSERMLQLLKDGVENRRRERENENSVEITLSPVKDEKGRFSAACAHISAIGLRFN